MPGDILKLKSTNAINIIAWVSISAIIIGTTALILVLSVFNGFEGLVKSLYSSFYTDIRISPASGKVMTITSEQIQQLKGLTGIKIFLYQLKKSIGAKWRITVCCLFKRRR